MIFTILLTFHSCIPRLVAVFNEQGMELFMSGLPDINIEDLKTQLYNQKYSVASQQIVWYDNSSVDSFRI